MTEEPSVNVSSSVENGELLTSQDVLIRARVIDELNKKTEQDNNEFWAFILGKQGVGEKHVFVGLQHKHGVVVSPKQVVQTLRPHIAADFEIIADYHNHPPDSVEEYSASGFPPEHATSPSVGNLRQEVPIAVQTELNQKPYPRLIALRLDRERKVILSAFNVKRYPTQEEKGKVEFYVADTGTSTENHPLVELTGASYGNPNKMIEHKLIQPIQLRTIDDNGNILDILNPLSEL